MFHKSRQLCCNDFGALPNRSACSFALHDDDAQLFSAVRAELARGRSCLTYVFLMEYASIVRSLARLTGGALPTKLLTSAAVHSMKHVNASVFRSEVDDYLALVSRPEWANTSMLLHTAASPNATAIALGHYPQTPERVRDFNDAIRAALATSAASGVWARQRRPVPRLVDYASVTANTPARFPYLDSLHFYDQFYQTAFMVDALVLNSQNCARRARQGPQSAST